MGIRRVPYINTRDLQTKTWKTTVIFLEVCKGSFSLWECCILPRQVSSPYQITISRYQDDPRIHHQRLRIGAVLTGKVTISGKDCFTKVVPKDDTDIWVANKILETAQTPLSL